ncbi:MAG: hypothetical protein ACI4VQ_06240 [Clostridia bacterium]
MEEIEEKINEIYDMIASADWEMSNALTEINSVLTNISNIENISIKNVENFKRELIRAGLYSEKLNEFVENYIRWDNQ